MYIIKNLVRKLHYAHMAKSLCKYTLYITKTLHTIYILGIEQIVYAENKVLYQ